MTPSWRRLPPRKTTEGNLYPIWSASSATVTLGGVACDNSLSVRAAAPGNGVTSPNSNPFLLFPPAGWRAGARLKRVCIPDEGQIRLARKQPIHLSAGFLASLRSRLSDPYKYVYAFYSEVLGAAMTRNAYEGSRIEKGKRREREREASLAAWPVEYSSRYVFW